MKTCNYLFLTIFLGVLPILQAQELKYVSPLLVSDSISSLSYDKLKKNLLGLNYYHLSTQDSLETEVLIKTLLIKSKRLEYSHAFANYYLELGKLRNDLEIFDYSHELGVEMNDIKIQCGSYLNKGLSLYKLKNYKESIRFLMRAY